MNSPRKNSAETPTRWWSIDAEQSLAQLESSLHGLSAQEAGSRLLRHGPNRLRSAETTNRLAIFLHQLTSPLIYVLLVAMLISLGIAWAEGTVSHVYDAVVIAIVLALNGTIGYFQEHRAENAILALMQLISPTATVVRDGQRRAIDSADLVPGDIVLLEAGDQVPADIRLLECYRLACDEATLTGESVPVGKATDVIARQDAVPLGDRKNLAFTGTLVTTGRARGVVYATGAATEIGKIAGEIRTARITETPLQRRMGRFAARISAVVVSISALAFVIGWYRGEELTTMFLTAVAIAVSAIPEGLPVVMTVALAVSVRRMVSQQAIVRKLAAIETLGSCTVIVTDKTGTLTQNQMTVQSIACGDQVYSLTGLGLDPAGSVLKNGEDVSIEPGTPLYETLQVGLLCNDSDLKRIDGVYSSEGDPTEVALLVAGLKCKLDREALLSSYHLSDDIPFSSEQQYAASIYDKGGEPRVFLKGAPERVVDMCTEYLAEDGSLHPIDRAAALGRVAEMAESGLRVLAMAIGTTAETVAVARAQSPSGLVLTGLVGMLDPPREGAADAIEACHRAGIRVAMVTGDHERTACAIARKLNLRVGEAAVSGTELSCMSDTDLDEALSATNVFARISPSDKLRIVERLKAQGEIVAVTGDGVNDAPALKSAHVGAAMGMIGTDVAKEASSIVLADDHFATIAAAAREGRVAFGNLRKATFFLVSSGFAELTAIIACLAAALPLPFLPAQILWLNVVTNGIEDVGLAFEPGEADVFARPPRDPREGVLSRLLIERMFLVGLVMAAGTLGIFLYEWDGDPARLAYAQVAALSTMVAFQVFHVGNSRSEHESAFRKSITSNRFLFFGVLITVIVHVAALYVPATQTLLRLQPLELASWLRIVCVASSILVVVEIHKRLRSPDVRKPAPGSSAA